MRLREIVVLVVVLSGSLAACSSAGASPAPPASATAATASTGAAREVAVRMTDALRFEPASFEVKAGETVRFVLTNAGKVRHEFFVGSEADQRDHEAEMRSMGMAHDEPNGISVEPGQIKTLEITFAAAGDLLAGCHEPGHYDGGMKATIAVGD